MTLRLAWKLVTWCAVMGVGGMIEQPYLGAAFAFGLLVADLLRTEQRGGA